MRKVKINEAYRFMVDCFKAVGTPIKAAEQQADVLIQADKIGHSSHGLNRLEFYLKDIEIGACVPKNKPKILKENLSTAWVDANNVLGATASHFSMDIAIKKAKETGVGWVTVKGSNHHGMTGWWAQKPAKQGLIGMAFTNTFTLLTPTRSKKPALGTNPISVVAPASQGETFYLDIATTAVSLGKIEIRRRKGEPIPDGWAQGPDGKETNDANVAFAAGCLMPLGGGEKTSGYKGYGLSAMVEIFCGISSGARYGHHIGTWTHKKVGVPHNLSHCFVAIDPENFAPGFGDRLAESMQHWRKLEPVREVFSLTILQCLKTKVFEQCSSLSSVIQLTLADPKYPVVAPGDMEKMAEAQTNIRGTVSYVPQQIESSIALAKRLKVKPMEVIEDN